MVKNCICGACDSNDVRCISGGCQLEKPPPSDVTHDVDDVQQTQMSAYNDDQDGQVSGDHIAVHVHSSEEIDDQDGQVSGDHIAVHVDSSEAIDDQDGGGNGGGNGVGSNEFFTVNTEEDTSTASEAGIEPNGDDILTHLDTSVGGTNEFFTVNTEEDTSTASEAGTEPNGGDILRTHLNTSGGGDRGGNNGSNETSTGVLIQTFIDLLLRYRPLLDRYLNPPVSTTHDGITGLGEGSLGRQGSDHVILTDLVSKYPELFIPLLGPIEPTIVIRVPESSNRGEVQDQEEGQHETHLSMATFIGSVIIPGSLSTSSFHSVGSRSWGENIQFYFFLLCYLLAVLFSRGSILVYLFTPIVTGGSSRRLFWASNMTGSSLFFMFVAFILSLITMDDTIQSAVVISVSGVFLISLFFFILWLKFGSVVGSQQ